MADYFPPTDDMLAALRTSANLGELLTLPAFNEIDLELAESVLVEASRLASEVVAPLNQVGDKQGSVLENGVVRTPDGWSDAYSQYVDGGWNGLAHNVEHGGQGLPQVLAMAVQEMWHGANMAFGLCPLLNQGAVELLQTHGTETQKATYLPNLITGRWTGTMNLTEPQAGSDLGSLTARAWRDGDRYRIKGQKIYISYGEHDLTENIVHMVLARLEDAPAGSRGISLFIVPKYLPNEDGAPGQRNDLRCVSLEHKLGIHASPTCTMAFGDNEGAVGFLVSQENRGLACMFTMMNNARVAVGVEGVGVAERAFQRAHAYARERVQGKAFGADDEGPIVWHPDVRRMLASMHARTQAMRALAYAAGLQLDLANHAMGDDERRQAKSRADLLTPLVKAWCTDTAEKVASTGVQVHGGMGYVEETGAAQHLRDVRITQIYEGTNGIQANDLVFRKVAGDGGEAARLLISDLENLAPNLGDAHAALTRATDWIISAAEKTPAHAAAASVPYLDLFARVVAGSLLSAEPANDIGQAAERRRAAAAQFFTATDLAEAQGLADMVVGGLQGLEAYAELLA